MTRGNWNEVWDSFARRQKAKARGDVVVVPDEGGEDMFSRAGVGVE